MDAPATPFSPDHSTCRNCGERISWDDICYVHDATGFADCSLLISGVAAEPGFLERLLTGRFKKQVSVLINPDIRRNRHDGATAEPVTWGRAF